LNFSKVLILFRKIINGIKDILFPKNCVGCGEEGGWLCDKCYEKLFFNSPQACLFCSKFITYSSICKDCVKKSALDGLVVLYGYEEKNVIARLIKLFKYSGVEDIVEVWERVFADYFWEPKRMDFIPEMLVPVPLHSRRERERGYNQAELIARVVNHHFPDAVLDAQSLVRKKYTEQQAKLTREKRILNIQDVFIWRAKESCPSQVLLIDDVFTTGSTMQECAKTLKRAGAREVWGLVLARG
jgi:ComF family protein